MLDALPPDVLEIIGFYTATHSVIGPPSGLLPLLTLSRSVYATLNRKANPHIYARIFKYKFDYSAPLRRLGKLNTDKDVPFNSRDFTAQIYAKELVRRFRVLQYIRAGECARVRPILPQFQTNARTYEEDGKLVDELLWVSYIMVTENEGRNVSQLKYYARIEKWLSIFWFSPEGLSGTEKALIFDVWPLSQTSNELTKEHILMRSTLAMWLFWFFLSPGSYTANSDLFRQAQKLLKLIALNAPLYPICHLPWTSFIPEPGRINFGSLNRPYDPAESTNGPPPFPPLTLPFEHFSYPITLSPPPPLAVPASLALLALIARYRTVLQFSNPDPVTALFPQVTVVPDGDANALRDLFRDFGGFGSFLLADTQFGRRTRESFTPAPFVAFRGLSVWDSQVGEEYIGTESKGGDKGQYTFNKAAINETVEPPIFTEDSRRWECEWLRCIQIEGFKKEDDSLREKSFPTTLLTTSTRPVYTTYEVGSVSDYWEGVFIYTEFTSYADILSGAKPSQVCECLMAQHAQTWRIREHHLLSPEGDISQSMPKSLKSTTLPAGITSTGKNPVNIFTPLPIGDPNFAHIPEGLKMIESSEGIDVYMPGETDSVRCYRRYSGFFTDTIPISSASAKNQTYTTNSTHTANTRRKSEGGKGVMRPDTHTTRYEQVDENERRMKDEEAYVSRVRDILLTGDGHSGWGEFKIFGRIRPTDGFITIMKEYTTGDRGRWLYRGYLVAGGNSSGEGEGSGYLVGRWRDTQTPHETYGYEGIFAMTRRR